MKERKKECPFIVGLPCPYYRHRPWILQNCVSNGYPSFFFFFLKKMPSDAFQPLFAAFEGFNHGMIPNRSEICFYIIVTNRIKIFWVWPSLLAGPLFLFCIFSESIFSDRSSSFLADVICSNKTISHLCTHTHRHLTVDNNLSIPSHLIVPCRCSPQIPDLIDARTKQSTATL